MKCYLSIPVRKLFYNAYILPHLDYCCTICGNVNLELMDYIVKFQKRAARCILYKDFDTPSAEMFAELKWMKFPERVQYQVIMMYKICPNLAPEYLQGLFQHTTDIHQKALRSASDNLLYVLKPNIEQFRNSLSYSIENLEFHSRKYKAVRLFKKYIEWSFTQTDH